MTSFVRSVWYPSYFTMVLGTCCRAVLTKYLKIGVARSDSEETVRQKRVLLVIMLALIAGGPLLCVVLFLASGMPWAALTTLLTGSLPACVAFVLYYKTHNVGISTWIVTIMPIFCISCVTVVCGGFRNAGYLPHYAFVSPLIWVCITRRALVGFVAFLAGVAAVAVFVAAEEPLYQWAVVTHGLVPELSSAMRSWHWLINMLQLQTLIFMFFGMTFLFPGSLCESALCCIPSPFTSLILLWSGNNLVPVPVCVGGEALCLH